MSGSVYSTRVHTKGTLPSRAAATSLAIEAGAAAEAGFSLVSKGLSLLQYALQTSTSSSAGLSPQPTFPARPELTQLPWSLWSFGAMVVFLVLPQQASVTTCGERSPPPSLLRRRHRPQHDVRAESTQLGEWTYATMIGASATRLLERRWRVLVSRPGLKVERTVPTAGASIVRYTSGIRSYRSHTDYTKEASNDSALNLHAGQTPNYLAAA